jgi:hypothetical protein
VSGKRHFVFHYLTKRFVNDAGIFAYRVSRQEKYNDKKTRISQIPTARLLSAKGKKT